jgi:dephospho-CoA kinase
MKIAITGGMGCGKSTVVNMLCEHLPEYKVASYDAEVKRMYAHDDAFRATLRQAFGTDAKSEVARMVFNDREKMKALFDLTLEPMNAFLGRVTSVPNIVVEVPMIHQIPYATRFFDTVFAVWCDPKTQRERIRERDGLSDEMINKKLKWQLSPDEIARRSNFVIDTSDDAVDLYEQLSVILRVASLKRV